MNGDTNEAYGSQPGGDNGEGTPNASGTPISGQEGSQPEGQESQANEQQYVTKQEFQSRLDEVLRSAQSMTDKMGSRLDKEIQSALNNATQAIELGKQAGVPYTPEQEQKIRDQAINMAYNKMQTQQGQESQAPASAQQAQEGGKQTYDPQWGWANQEVVRIMGETGVFIPGNEANDIILGKDRANKLTPYQYVQAFERIARQRQQNNFQPQGRNPAIPSYAQTGQAQTSKTALRQQYDRERAQIRSGEHPTIKKGDIMGIQRLEIEYRQKGLDDI